MLTALIFIVVVSFFTAIIFSVDKYCAVNGIWRVPEAVLLFCSAMGGAIGGIIAMSICHHKTQKPLFYRGLPLMLISQILILIITANIFLY